MGSYIDAWKNIGTVSGRLDRKGFWHFHLVAGLGFMLLTTLAMGLAGNERLVMAALTIQIAAVVFLLVHVPASITATIRRLHDFNASGWLVFLAVIPLAFLVIGCVDSSPGDNAFGPGTGNDASTRRRVLQALADIEAIAAARRTGTITEAEFALAKNHILAA